MHYCEVMLKVSCWPGRALAAGTREEVSPGTLAEGDGVQLQGTQAAPHWQSEMPACSLPPQDMADSRRINANIRDEEQKLPEEERPPFDLIAVILSSEFWPPLKEEKLELPEHIKEAMEAYSKKYEKLKVRRAGWRDGGGKQPAGAPALWDPLLSPPLPQCRPCQPTILYIYSPPGHADAELEASLGLGEPGRGAGRPHPLALCVPCARGHHPPLPEQE